MPYSFDLLGCFVIVAYAVKWFREAEVAGGGAGPALERQATTIAASSSLAVPSYGEVVIGLSLCLLILSPHAAAEGAVPLAPGTGDQAGCARTVAAVVAGICLLAASGLLVWVRKAVNVHYQVASGGVCFAARRGVVAARGLAVGSLLSLPVSIAIYHWLGPLSPGGMPLVLGFLIGTTVYSQWIMRHWNGLDTCRDCHEVRRRLHALHKAGITLGLLLIAVLLSIAWPTP
jgi:hypothetical protein